VAAQIQTAAKQTSDVAGGEVRLVVREVLEPRRKVGAVGRSLKAAVEVCSYQTQLVMQSEHEGEAELLSELQVLHWPVGNHLSTTGLNQVRGSHTHSFGYPSLQLLVIDHSIIVTQLGLDGTSWRSFRRLGPPSSEPSARTTLLWWF
jgi:hypothetical protein